MTTGRSRRRSIGDTAITIQDRMDDSGMPVTEAEAMVQLARRGGKKRVTGWDGRALRRDWEGWRPRWDGGGGKRRRGDSSSRGAGIRRLK